MRRTITLTEALVALRPGAQFVLRDNDYSKLEWYSPEMLVPTENELNLKMAELEAEEPMRLMRQIRDWLLQQCDWTQAADIRQLRSPEWCAAWDDYRQQLRDITQNQTPYFANPQDMHISGVTWPTVPPSK